MLWRVMQADSVISATLERARELGPLTPSSLEVRRLSRELRRSHLATEVRVAYAGNIICQEVLHRRRRGG